LGKVFLRSDPSPANIKATANARLINNNNRYSTFLKQGTEDYKVRVFENFKDMSRQMNKAYLRLMENKKFFKAGAGGAIPEDRQKSKDEDDRTLDQIGTIFKYIHGNQKVAAGVAGSARYGENSGSIA